MSDDQKEMIEQWEKKDKSLSPITFTKDKETKKFALEANTKNGSEGEKNDLVHAGICLATGAKSSYFGEILLNSCLMSGGIKLDEMNEVEAKKILQGILDSLYSLQPNDEIEGMLITKLISLHFQTNKYMSFLSNQELSVEQVDSCINRSSKLMRLYNETLETLMRYRRKGEQRFLVQHVNVNDGGRAIVGGFETGGGVNKNNRGTP